jgi:hypothetical protein
MTDRERINALVDQLASVQKQNDELKSYAEILEKLLGVVNLDNMD